MALHSGSQGCPRDSSSPLGTISWEPSVQMAVRDSHLGQRVEGTNGGSGEQDVLQANNPPVGQRVCGGEERGCPIMQCSWNLHGQNKFVSKGVR